MTITEEQMRLLRALSDVELYRQAIDFLNQIVEMEGEPGPRPPLPNTQIHGLLNVAQANTYSALKKFIKHQHSERSWDKKNAHIEIFYKDLDREIEKLPPIAEREGVLTEASREEREKIKHLLACEFIQHLAAENLVREMERKERADEEKENKKKGRKS